MRIKKKILLIFCITALLFLTSLGGITLYFYTHPSAVKPFIEKSISRSTGISLTINDLSYSLKPLKIRAKGIRLKPGEDLPGFHMEIPGLKADMSLEGPFGRKTLTFNNFRIDGLSFELSKGMTLPKKMPQKKEPSLFDRTLKGAIGLFLFRDIKFHAAELVRGDVTIQMADQKLKIHSIRANLNPEHLIEITCAAQMKWPSKRLSLSIPHLKITTDRAISFVEPKIGALLMAQEVTFQGPEADVKNMGARAKLTYDHNHKKLTFEPLDLHLKGVSLKQEPETKLPLPNLHLQAEGHLNLRESKLNVPHFHLTASDILKSEGSLMAGLGPQTGIELNILGCHLLPQKLMHLLPGRMKVMLTPYTLSGPVRLNGNINGLKELEKWRWHSDLQAHLKQNPFSYKTNQIQLNGLATGNIQTKGIFPEIRILAGLEGDNISFSGMGMELKPFKSSLSLTGKHPAYMIKDLALHLPSAKVAMGKRDLLIDDIHLHILKGRLDGEKRSLSLPEIRFDSSLLKNLMLSLRYDEKQVTIKIQGKQTRLIESALALNMLPSGWQFGGLDSFQISAILKEQGDCSFTSRLGFQDLGFQNQDSSCMGEKISINAEINGKIDMKGSYIAANTSLELKEGEILYDRFYIDLNKNAFFSSCEGHCDISKKTLQLSNLRLGLKDILTLDIHGSLLRKAWDNHLHLSSTVPETSLKPLFHHFIQEPFQTEKPFLTDLNIGGIISADLGLTGSGKNWTIMGTFRWHKGEFSLGDHDLSFQGTDFDLPIWYQNLVTSDELQVTSTKKNSSLIKKSIKGMLSIKSMALPLLPKQPLTLRLDAGPNMLSVKSSTILRIPGGNIRLGPVIGRGLFGSRPSIETSLTLDSIALKPFLSGILSQPIRGTINGRLDPIHLEGDALKCHGEIKLDVFGGEVILSDLGASGIFTAAPVVKLSARWNDLSLEEMTTGTSFGKIKGALRGHIKEMEIAYGQPQRFDMLLETVKKKGVSQEISVRAVDSIARIGGGQSPFMGLAGAFSSFFKKFPYKKIGVHASLENDVFRINGTIREGGKEYLMKSGSISGVNIVNQSTDNRISFKDMIKRIRRVTAAGASPVVK